MGSSSSKCSVHNKKPKHKYIPITHDSFPGLSEEEYNYLMEVCALFESGGF